MEVIKPRIKSTIWNIRKKKAFSLNSRKKKEFKKRKNKDRIRSFWDISKSTNIRITGVPEGKEEAQEIENLFENIMKVP